MKKMTISSAKLVMTNVLVLGITYVTFLLYLFKRLMITTQYSWFHVIFSIGAMYVAMLLTDWYVISIISILSKM